MPCLMPFDGLGVKNPGIQNLIEDSGINYAPVHRQCAVRSVSPSPLYIN